MATLQTQVQVGHEGEKAADLTAKVSSCPGVQSGHLDELLSLFNHYQVVL
jgi:hypothetical protein